MNKEYVSEDRCILSKSIPLQKPLETEPFLGTEHQ